MTSEINSIKGHFRIISDAELEIVSGGNLHINGEGVDPVTLQNGTAGNGSLPTTWEDTTWGEALCWSAAMLFSGGNELFSDIACDTDLTGENPNQTGLTPEEQREREANALKEAGEAAFEQADDLLNPTG